MVLMHYPQGFFSGTYNGIYGRVRRNTTDIGEINGRWSHVMDFKNPKVPQPNSFIFTIMNHIC